MNKTRVFFGLCFLTAVLALSYQVKTSVEEKSELNWTKENIQQEIEKKFQWKEELSLLAIANSPYRITIQDPKTFDCIERMFNLERFKACGLGGEKSFLREDFMRAKNIFADIKLDTEVVDPKLKSSQLFEKYFKSSGIEKSMLEEEELHYFEDLYLSLKAQFLLVDNPELRAYYLYALGDLGLQLWTENRDMEGALFFAELILENSRTDLAKMAWMNLNSHIQFAYSGSAGVNVPGKWQTLIDDLQKVAFWGYPREYFRSVQFEFN
ncbi:MAG: hypothetical protein VX642_02735 [Bdellovibrionota bacterium]|nr:hypothetical protein [Bdellovibrionota bacterium]